MHNTLVSAPSTLNIREVYRFSLYILRKMYLHAALILITMAAVSYLYSLLFHHIDPEFYTKLAKREFTPLAVWLFLSYGALMVLLEITLWQSINATLLNRKNSLFSSLYVVSNYILNLFGAMVITLLLPALLTIGIACLWKILPLAPLSPWVLGIILSFAFAVLYYFYLPLIIIENNLNFIKALGRSCRFLYARALENFLMFIVVPVSTIILIVLSLQYLIFPYLSPNLCQYIIWFLASMVPLLYVFTRIVICVQIYNIKISLGENPPPAMMDKLFSNSFI